mmetsp:Transcript_1447/g.4936  ORF Transcript_1447/g.4936 Transcript_1447/m.4936 type:complete len:237 (-) Transcript_1447:1173-1883(-)
MQVRRQGGLVRRALRGLGHGPGRRSESEVRQAQERRLGYGQGLDGPAPRPRGDPAPGRQLRRHVPRGHAHGLRRPEVAGRRKLRHALQASVLRPRQKTRRPRRLRRHQGNRRRMARRQQHAPPRHHHRRRRRTSGPQQLRHGRGLRRRRQKTTRRHVPPPLPGRWRRGENQGDLEVFQSSFTQTTAKQNKTKKKASPPSRKSSFLRRFIYWISLLSLSCVRKHGYLRSSEAPSALG